MTCFIRRSLRYRLPDLPPEGSPVPQDVISERIDDARRRGDMTAVRLLQAADYGLQFTEAQPRESALPIWESIRRERAGQADTSPRLPMSEWCLKCILRRCANDADWKLALTQVAHHTLPDVVRINAAVRLACQRRCTETVVRQLLNSLSDDESDHLRSEVLLTAHTLGDKAAAIVPRAIQIVQSISIDPNPDCRSIGDSIVYAGEPLHADALRVVVSCHTPDDHDAASFLCDRTDHRRYGIPTAWRTIWAISHSKAFQDRYLDRLVTLAVDHSVPQELREAAVRSSSGLLHRSHRHIAILCALLANPSTPEELRTAACESLDQHASFDNPVAPAFAAIVDDPLAPGHLRLRALCAFRGMPIEVQHLSLKPAIRFLNWASAATNNVSQNNDTKYEFPLAVADIIQDLIADVIHLALPPSTALDEHDFLKTALPVPFELRLRNRLHSAKMTAARSFLLGRDFFTDLVKHPWLLTQLGYLLPRRMRSLANGTREDVLKALQDYVVEILNHPHRPLLPDPDNVESFPQRLVARVDGFAKYHLPQDFGLKVQERHGRTTVNAYDQPGAIPDFSSDPADTASQEEVLTALTSALAKLDELERQVIQRCVIQGMSLDEGAASLGGVSRDRVFRAKKRALKKLRSALLRFAS